MQYMWIWIAQLTYVMCNMLSAFAPLLRISVLLWDNQNQKPCFIYAPDFWKICTMIHPLCKLWTRFYAVGWGVPYNKHYNKTVYLLKLSVSVLSVGTFLSTILLCATCLWIGVHLRTCHQLLYWPLLLWKIDMKQIGIRFTASRHHGPQTDNKIRFSRLNLGSQLDFQVHKP